MFLFRLEKPFDLASAEWQTRDSVALGPIRDYKLSTTGRQTDNCLIYIETYISLRNSARLILLVLWSTLGSQPLAMWYTLEVNVNHSKYTKHYIDVISSSNSPGN